MKQLLILPILLVAALLCGCANVNNRSVVTVAPGSLAVRTSLLGMMGNERDARIYVDGRFIGNYEPDDTVLALPAGKHVVAIEIPHVYERRIHPNGNTVILNYTIKGEERIEVLGGGSKQSLVFNDDNLKAKEIKDDNGH